MNDSAASDGIGAWRWPLLAVCLVLALLSVRNAAQALFAGGNPALAARFWPADGNALADLALNRVIAAGGTVDPTSAALARRALSRSPRAATPLVVAGLDASATGDLARAQALMEAARARQPRTDIARFWLLDHYMRTGNYAAGLDEIAPAIALRGASEPPLMNLVAALAVIPAAHRALIDKLEKQPRWRVAFFQQEANAALPPGTILSLLEALPANSDPAAANAEQQAVIGASLSHGAYAEAYGAWQSFLPPADRPVTGMVYDPDFLGLPGSEPFNWRLETADDLTVARANLPDIAERSGLAIEFRGTIPKPIASETLPVAPGDYLFSLKARRAGNDATAAAGRIVATARCLSGNAPLAILPLDPLTLALRVFQVGLTVPPNCPAIVLQLSGEPGDTFGVTTTQLTAVSLTRR